MDMTCQRQPAAAVLAAGEQVRPAWGRVDHRLHVAVVHADQAVRHGLARLLEHDPRLHLMDPVASIGELGTSGLRFDVCVLGLPDAAAADQLTDLVGGVPCVLWTSGGHWRPWVAAWIWGARNVLGQEVGRVPLADAVWDAVHNPYEVHPKLARALLAAAAASGVHVSAGLTDVLARVADGRRVLPALSMTGLSVAAYVADLTALRIACERAGLGVLPTGEGGRPADGSHVFEPSVVPPEALVLSARIREVLKYYADGYDYEEIARLLNITEATVKTHVLTAMDKFGIVANRSSEVRLLFAIYISGRHRHPDLVRRRLEILRTTVRLGTPE